ncbi:MAG: peptide chain release factor 2 [Bacteroidales bacterium]|nr:peptide chain release factor 2 [Bacteroidales bacterium]MCF8326681.1 peptide chain release factor 2 [Bacteroidales bacterium]
MITKDALKSLRERVEALRGYLDVDRKRIEIQEQEEKTMDPDFWNEPQKAEALLKDINDKRHWVKKYDNALAAVEELEVLMDFYQEEGEGTEEEIEQKYKDALNRVEGIEFLNMLSGDEDKLNCILQINPGAGGTESQDWAEMLERMYLAWAEKNDFKTTIIDRQEGDVAGIKSVSIEIDGDYAFGYLKGENGVHRLVRISPFDSAKKRHTSFASVYVYPVVDDSIEIEVDPADISWDTFRSSGPGGQHVNKTESAVRLHHEPTGIAVECQENKSQLKNRKKAMVMLKSKLYEIEMRKKEEARSEIENSKKKIEWGSQIRNYVFHPYKLVKDLRTNLQKGNVQEVMNGEINDFIKAYLMEYGG